MSVAKAILVSVAILVSLQALCAQNLLNNPESVVYDQLNDRYLVSNFGDGSIVAIDAEENQTYFSTELSRVAGLYIHDNQLLVAANQDPYLGLVVFDLETDQLSSYIPIPDATLPNDLCVAPNGYVYITDYWDTAVYRVDLAEETWELFAREGLTDPNGIVYDPLYQRLIVTSTVGPEYPYYAIDPDDGSSIYEAYQSHLSSGDGIARDDDGDYYICSWTTNACYRVDPHWQNPPELVSDGHDGPADIYFDSVNDLLCVPNFNRNDVDFIYIEQTGTDGHSAPDHVTLAAQLFPNPFNPETTLRYSIPNPDDVRIEIFNVRGRKVRSLLDERRDAGYHETVWKGDDDAGKPVGSGVYFIRVSAGRNEKIVKGLLLK